MNEIENANTTNAKATTDSVYTIHKDTLTNTSNTFQINQQQQACPAVKCAHIQAVAIEFSTKRERKFSSLRTFVRLNL